MNTTTKIRCAKRRLGATSAIVAALSMAGFVAGCSMMGKAANEGISDADITSGVEMKLAAESRLTPYKIQVKTDDGVVHLSGDVGTGGDRDVAEKVTLSSRGVVRVDNYIQFGLKPPVITQ